MPSNPVSRLPGARPLRHCPAGIGWPPCGNKQRPEWLRCWCGGSESGHVAPFGDGAEIVAYPVAGRPGAEHLVVGAVGGGDSSAESGAAILGEDKSPLAMIVGVWDAAQQAALLQGVVFAVAA